MCRTIQFIIRIGGTMEEILDMLEHALWEYEKVMKNNSIKKKIILKIENVWKETNTVVKRGNAEKSEKCRRRHLMIRLFYFLGDCLL